MKQARSLLSNASNPDARFDSLCLAEKAFALDKTRLRLHADRIIDPTQYFALVSRRVAGEPLQYILGEWEFYGLRFRVGPGVLIPRPETELLVELALDFLHDCRGGLQATRLINIFDLCAGSGCVGLSIAHHCPSAQVHLLEISPEALPYLRENAKNYPNAHVHEADIFNAKCFMLNAQLILANPPYIKSAEIPQLSREVRHEPRLALDGGADGLDFYRALATSWLPTLTPGGMLAAECGDGQAEDVAEIFAKPPASEGGSDSAESRGVYKTEIHRDFNGIERIVVATP